MNSELDPQVRSIIRASIFDWLGSYVSREIYSVDIHQGAHQVLEKLFKEGELPSQPPSNVPFEALSSHGVSKNLLDFITQSFWELHLQGMLSPTPSWVSSGNAVFYTSHEKVSAIITSYGKELLNEDTDRIRTHDPDGYIAGFYASNPDPDPEMMCYVEEAIRVFHSGHLFATVVLLGIASERLVEVLALSLSQALGEKRGKEWYQSKYDKKFNISDRFEAVSAKLVSEYGEELKKERILEDFKKIVTTTFEIIRSARNEVAHPKGRNFSWNDVSGFLHLYVSYFKCVNRVIIVLKNPS